jgi:DNA-directed RNA polymerase subunit RPC12/RpoP
MPLIVLRLTDFQSNQEDRPTHCPYCGSQVFQRWGASAKTVQDAKSEVSAYYRYHCNSCGHTFRNYPPGIDRTKMTQRIRSLAALAWALGLSARKVVEIFKDLGIEMSHMVVWRDGTELISRIGNASYPDRPSRYWIDKLFLKNEGRGIGTSIVLDLGEGKTAVLGKIDEVNSRVVLNWLAPFIKDLDIQVSIFGTDVLHRFDTNSESDLDD